MALTDKIKAIADAIRNKTGSTGLMTLDEMAESIEYMDASSDGTQTYILVDEDGYEIPAVLTEEEVELTATANDIRIGTTAVTDDGVIEGEKEIPAYKTNEGFKLIPSGYKFVLTMQEYNYTKLQAIICPYDTSLIASVGAEMVVINDSVYLVQSTAVYSNVVKNDETMQIDFGFSNEFEVPCLIRYIMYKEI